MAPPTLMAAISLSQHETERRKAETHFSQTKTLHILTLNQTNHETLNF